jgi:hypothetical protein
MYFHFSIPYFNIQLQSSNLLLWEISSRSIYRNVDLLHCNQHSLLQYNKSNYLCMHLLVISHKKSSVHVDESFKIYNLLFHTLMSIPNYSTLRSVKYSIFSQHKPLSIHPLTIALHSALSALKSSSHWPFIVYLLDFPKFLPSTSCSYGLCEKLVWTTLLEFGKIIWTAKGLTKNKASFPVHILGKNHELHYAVTTIFHKMEP